MAELNEILEEVQKETGVEIYTAAEYERKKNLATTPKTETLFNESIVSKQENENIILNSNCNTVEGNVQDDSVAIQSDEEFVPMSSEEYEHITSGEKNSLPNTPNLADYINSFDIRIVADKYLQRASNDTYICECGSGAHGHHNTGLHYYQDEQGRHRLKCFACGRNFKVIDLILHCEKLDNHGEDFKKALKIACDIYGVDADSNLDVMPETKEQSTDERAVKPSKLLSHMDFARDNLKNFFSTKTEYRGIPYEDYQRARVGYFAKHFFSDVHEEHPALAFQTYHDSIFFRAVDGSGKDWNGGSSITVFNLPNTDIENSTVFIVEGSFDALSILTATNWNAYVVCSNGTSTLQKFKITIEKIFPAQKPSFVLMLDNDDKDGRNAGQDAAQKWVEELQKSYIVVNRVLTDEKNVDANKFLISYGVEELKKRIEDIANSAQVEFKKLRNELSTRKADETSRSLTDEQRKFLFSGDLSDLTNARRIAFYFKDKLRYVRDSDVWATYDGTKWLVASDSKNTLLYPHVSKFADILKANARTKRENKIAETFHELKKVNPAINFIKSVENIFITREDLNTHRNLLNCQNGVVDLETKKLYPHSPNLLLTQCVNGVFKPNCYSDVINNFFISVVPDEQTRAALLRFLGYCLTGEIREEKALFIYGTGGNGKGSLSQTLLRLINSYGTAFPIEGVLKRFKSKDANAATPIYNQLEFKRLGIAEEIPRNELLDLAKFKLLTGGDPLPIRKLHAEASTIAEPTHKMIFSGNHLPKLDDVNDGGLQRRLLVIKFTQNFRVTGNVNLKRQLATPNALNGLLTMLVDNAVQWYKGGLLYSDDMSRAKNDYLTQQNFVLEFIEENCVFVASSEINFSEFINKLRNYSATPKDLSERELRNIVTQTLEGIDGVQKSKRGIYKISGLGFAVSDADADKYSRNGLFS